MDEKFIFINNEKTEYTVDVDGRIYSNHTNRYLKPFKNPSGYYLIDLHHNGNSYTRQVHRLVANAFIPNPDKLPTVNHINGDKSCNAVWNLEWMSIKDNVQHAWKTGLAKPRYGTDNPANVYSEEQIYAVCAYLEADVLNNHEIANKCGVNVTLIRDIKFRGKWKQISCQYDINKIPAGLKDIRQDIMNLMEQGYKNKEILIILGIPESKKRNIEYVRSIYNAKRNRGLNDYSGNGSTPISK
jgi:hypothetical protein